MNCCAVILAGGWGERFWPVSRESRPKQLLRLTASGKTMLAEAVDRVMPVVGAENVFVATSLMLRQPIVAALDELDELNVFSEPAKRNTAGAICWTLANLIAEIGDGAHAQVVAFLTADHAISTEAQFRDTFESAVALANETNGLVTIGMRPDRPETGYGYLEQAPIAPVGKAPTFRVTAFREKPSAAVAEGYLASGKYLWNGGMFFGRVSTFLLEIEKFAPEARAAIDQIVDALRNGDALAAEVAFCTLPNISFDYLVMEKSQVVYGVQALFSWDDLGAWDALTRTVDLDDAGNAIVGDCVTIDSNGNVLYNDLANGVIATLGVSDLVVVATDAAILVTRRDLAQDVRRLAQQLRDRQG